MDVDRFADLLETADDLPYEEQVVPLEEAVEIADEAEDERLGAYARLRLVSAYLFGDDPRRMFAPYAWLVQRYDAGTAWIDQAFRRQILWQGKWMPMSLYRYPEVPKEALTKSLDDLRRRYEAAGAGPEPVENCAYELTAHIEGEPAAQALYERWVASPRTDLSDCEACTPETRVLHFVALEDWERAVAEAEPVLDGTFHCESQPQGILATLLIPYAETGRLAQAASAHLRQWRADRDDPAAITRNAHSLVLLARTGATARGLELLAHRFGDIEGSRAPLERLFFAAAALNVLDRAISDGLGSEVLVLPGRADETIAALRDQVQPVVADLSRRFDERNGSTAVSDAVARYWLNATPLPPLPLGGANQPPEVVGASKHPLAPSLDDLASIPLVDLAERLESAQQYAGEVSLRAISEAWMACREAELATVATRPATDVRAMGDLEYGRAWTNPNQPLPVLREHVASAAALFRRSRDEAEALLAEQWLGALEGDMITTIGVLLPVMWSGDRSQHLRALCRRATAETNDESRRKVIDDVLELTAQATDARMRRYRAIALLLSNRTADPDPDAADDAIALLVPDPHGTLPGQRIDYPQTVVSALLQRAGVEASAGDREAARETAARAEGLARWSGVAPELAATLILQGRIAVASGDLPEAEQRFVRAMQVADATGQIAQAIDARGLLADLLRGQGRAIEAADMAERALADADEAVAAEYPPDVADPNRCAALAGLAGLIASDLGENDRAIALSRRAATELDALDKPAAAADAYGTLGELLARTGDAIGAVTAYRSALDRARKAGSARTTMVMLREMAWPTLDADGPVAALAVVDEAWRTNEENEVRALTEPVFAEELGQWDFDWERLDLGELRARMLGAVRREADGLAALADIPEKMLAAGAEMKSLSVRVLRGQLLIGSQREQEGLDELAEVATRMLAYGEDAYARYVAGIGAGYLSQNGREDEADAYWARVIGRQG